MAEVFEIGSELLGQRESGKCPTKFQYPIPENSKWNPLLGIAIGAFIAIVIYHYHWESTYLRNMTVGLILATLAIDLIPRITRLSYHAESTSGDRGSSKLNIKDHHSLFGVPIRRTTFLTLLGIITGAILVYIFTKEQERYQIRKETQKVTTLISVAPLIALLLIGGFLIGITFDLSTSANVVLSITLGTIFMTLLISWMEDLLGKSSTAVNGPLNKPLTVGIVIAIISILMILSIALGRHLGTKYIGTSWYYFFTAFAIGLLIWLIITRLLTFNLEITRQDVPKVASAVFIGFTLGWLIHQ